MKREGGEPARGRELDEIREELAKARRQLAELEERVARLEVGEELWQEPGAAGDEPVPR